MVHAAGGQVEARAVVIATGVTWRRLGVPGLESLTLRDRASDSTQTVPAAALFVMIGAEPRTTWLPGSIERDDQGFIRTGPDLHRAGELPVGWPLKRPPLLLETSVPGVFAAGTCGTGPSSGSPRPWEKAPPPSSSSTNTCAPSKAERLGGGVLIRERGHELGPGVDVELAVDLAQVELDRLG